jgi:hypothetical protein
MNIIAAIMRVIYAEIARCPRSADAEEKIMKEIGGNIPPETD